MNIMYCVSVRSLEIPQSTFLKVMISCRRQMFNKLQLLLLKLNGLIVRSFQMEKIIINMISLIITTEICEKMLVKFNLFYKFSDMPLSAKFKICGI